MIRRPPRYTRTDPTVPYSMLFRAKLCARRKESEAARYREHEIVATGAIVCGDDFEDSLTDFGGRQHLGLAQRRRGHARAIAHRSEEHKSELQSLMRRSYAVFCLKKKRH